MPWLGDGPRRAVYAALLAVLLIVAASVTTPSTRAQHQDALTLSTASTSTGEFIADDASPIIPSNLDAAIDQKIAGMSLDEELGQLFIAELQGTTLTDEDVRMVEQLHAGGIILYNFNLTSTPQARALITSAQAHATLPLLVTIDEEGGFVDRLSNIYGYRPSASQIGATGSASYARAQGQQAGADMAALGFNLDLAPDVDVQLVAGPDQRTRTFGSTPGAVTTLAGAYLDGLHDAGVGGTLKHFPGLGAATSDAHKDLPVINRSRGQIEAVELAPYRTLIASGDVDAIMTTDVLMPALDPTMPAELSPTIVNGILRGELGYTGVVITDALYMAGVTDRYTMAQAAVLAIEAGDDLLEGPGSAEQMAPMIQALREAVQSGKISKAQIDQSVHRILYLKAQLGLLPLTWPRPQPINQDLLRAWVPRICGACGSGN